MLEIIYEEKDFIVINKPPGLSVHGGLSVRGETLIPFLLQKYPEIKNVGDDPVLRPGIVHRLDRDTSGVMVIARTQKGFEALKEQFMARKVAKTYLVLVCGAPKNRRGTIIFPIGRLIKNPLKRGVVAGKSRIRGEREAVTEYEIVSSTEKFSLVRVFPKTGRMHQIRVHLKAIGCPVACDRIYGGKNVCCPEGVSRQLLHAFSLSFSLKGHAFTFEADLPEDFKNALSAAELGTE